jgi:hypothetical protein
MAWLILSILSWAKGFVPFFDEEGMEKATYLFLFQDPGHSGEKSKKVSH